MVMTKASPWALLSGACLLFGGHALADANAEMLKPLSLLSVNEKVEFVFFVSDFRYVTVGKNRLFINQSNKLGAPILRGWYVTSHWKYYESPTWGTYSC